MLPDHPSWNLLQTDPSHTYHQKSLAIPRRILGSSSGALLPRGDPEFRRPTLPVVLLESFFRRPIQSHCCQQVFKKQNIVSSKWNTVTVVAASVVTISLLIKTHDNIQPIFLLKTIGVAIGTIPNFSSIFNIKICFLVWVHSAFLEYHCYPFSSTLSCQYCKKLRRFFLPTPLTENHCNWLDVFIQHVREGESVFEKYGTIRRIYSVFLCIERAQKIIVPGTGNSVLEYDFVSSVNFLNSGLSLMLLFCLGNVINQLLVLFVPMKLFAIARLTVLLIVSVGIGMNTERFVPILDTLHKMILTTKELSTDPCSQ